MTTGWTISVGPDTAAAYGRTGRAVVSEALPPSHAEAAHALLSNQLPAAWTATFAPGREPAAGRVDYRDTPSNQAAITAERTAARSWLAAGRFSYHYYRLNTVHADACSCAICACRASFSAPENLAILSEVTGRSLSQLCSAFWSWFRAESFLSQHVDTGNGAVGFIYQLTRDWRPEYGGALHFAHETSAGAGVWIANRFNSLVLFDVDSSAKSPHFVSTVAAGTRARRLALTGWLA
jgi:Rps23 Pro-64 3,4-dihydroxylase Tpa1-like proline 4-hydroxylase